MTATAKRVQPEPPPARIVLEMDERDASVLRRVCGLCGGDSNGPRGAMDRIGDALDSAGVRPRGDTLNGSPGTLYFVANW